jgi:acyl carrier protein
MQSTFETLREIISEICEISADDIRPGVHLLQELGVDSLDILDIVHVVNHRFEVTVPLAEWVAAVSRGVPDSHYFVIDRLVEHVDALAAKTATS